MQRGKCKVVPVARAVLQPVVVVLVVHDVRALLPPPPLLARNVLVQGGPQGGPGGVALGPGAVGPGEAGALHAEEPGLLDGAGHPPVRLELPDVPDAPLGPRVREGVVHEVELAVAAQDLERERGGDRLSTCNLEGGKRLHIEVPRLYVLSCLYKVPIASSRD